MIDTVILVPGLLIVAGAAVLGLAIASELRIARESRQFRRQAFANVSLAPQPAIAEIEAVQVIDLRDKPEVTIDLRERLGVAEGALRPE